VLLEQASIQELAEGLGRAGNVHRADARVASLPPLPQLNARFM
jgi:hypothetical protein